VRSAHRNEGKERKSEGKGKDKENDLGKLSSGGGKKSQTMPLWRSAKSLKRRRRIGKTIHIGEATLKSKKLK